MIVQSTKYQVENKARDTKYLPAVGRVLGTSYKKPAF